MAAVQQILHSWLHHSIVTQESFHVVSFMLLQGRSLVLPLSLLISLFRSSCFPALVLISFNCLNQRHRAAIGCSADGAASMLGSRCMLSVTQLHPRALGNPAPIQVRKATFPTRVCATVSTGNMVYGVHWVLLRADSFA